MRVISIDIETTGIEKNKNNQILEFGALIFDTDQGFKPCRTLNKTFTKRLIHKNLSGSPFALNMNKGLIEGLVKYEQLKQKRHKGICTEAEHDFIEMYIEPTELVTEFKKWLIQNDAYDGTNSLNVAGKNVGLFDIPFLENTIDNWISDVKTRRRVLDPAILYTNSTDDKELPNLEECKKRSGLFTDDRVTHVALDDAEDVAILIWNKMIY